jgi:hypothetical protein
MNWKQILKVTMWENRREWRQVFIVMRPIKGQRSKNGNGEEGSFI